MMTIRRKGFLATALFALALPGLASAQYLNAATIHRLIADHQSGRADNSRALWLIWMFEEFLESENSNARFQAERTSAGAQAL